MKVLLKRNLFLGGSRYRRDPYGTEIPDMVDGRKVVLFSEWKPGADTIPLPRDATLFDPAKPVEVLPTDFVKPTRQKAVALSQLPKLEMPIPPVATTVKNELL